MLAQLDNVNKTINAKQNFCSDRKI
jgi:hypothetical protein